MRVLIAEDDLTSRDILVELLEKSSFDVLEAENGMEAWNIMRQPFPPQMIILDWLMPELDGLDVCRRIRSLKTDNPPYIILLTIKGNVNDIITGLDAGADDYISKPYDPGELHARVEVGRRIVELQQDLAGRIKELSLSRDLFRSFVENANDIIYTLDENGIFTYVSPNWTSMLGHDVSEVNGYSFERFVHPDDIPACLEFMKLVISSGKKQRSIEYRVRHKNGTWFWHFSNASIINDDKGQFISFLGVAHDITERKLADDKIKKLLTEKEILLKEVHHRIKNNMNNIIGLLSMQSNIIKDPAALSALEDVRNRVYSMMVLYDKLYCSDNFRELSVNEYLPVLVKEIILNLFNGSVIKIETHIEDFHLTAEILFPLGIIVNELLTNMMKYAFPEKDGGIITLTASRKDNRATITVGDNGVGLPETVSIEKSSGYGMELVGLLVKQIGGRIDIERGEGTKFIIEFDL